MSISKRIGRLEAIVTRVEAIASLFVEKCGEWRSSEFGDLFNGEVLLQELNIEILWNSI